MYSFSGENFELKLIRTSGILLHEECEDDRYNKLIERFRKEKVLYNPLIVGEHKGKHILIDGANRFEALRRIGCKTVLAQVVQYNNPRVHLKSWYHFVARLSEDVIGEYLLNNKLAHRITAPIDFMERFHQRLNFVGVITNRNRAMCIEFSHRLPEMLHQLCNLNKFYEQKFNYNRIDSDVSLSKLKRFLGSNGVLFIYPFFKKVDIVKIASSKGKLPAGITRHILPNRILHIKYSIELMKSDRNLDLRNRELKQLIDNKIDNRKARLYKESIMIFDE